MEHYLGARRTVPLHATVQHYTVVEDTAQNNDLQQVAGAPNSTTEHATPRPEEFTISVEQVREHFRKKGVNKSKDTVQRWCRTGELSCQKLGLLNRYFTTEASLRTLEAKLLPDMIAETAGEMKTADSDVQQVAAARTDEDGSVQVHSPEDAAARPSMHQVETAVPPHAGASNDRQDKAANFEGVIAENAGLREQLKSKESEIEFLREEVRAARDQRGAVVQISNRMLETLETIAIGGRLDRPKAVGGGGPVRYPSQNSDQGAV